MVTIGLILSLFLLGLWGIIRKDNLIKKVISLNILSSSIIMLYIHWGSRLGSEIPIVREEPSNMVDPVPQALMLTAIVIGVCLTALALSITRKLHCRYGTLSVRRIEDETRRGRE